MPLIHPTINVHFIYLLIQIGCSRFTYTVFVTKVQIRCFQSQGWVWDYTCIVISPALSCHCHTVAFLLTNLPNAFHKNAASKVIQKCLCGNHNNDVYGLTECWWEWKREEREQEKASEVNLNQHILQQAKQRDYKNYCGLYVKKVNLLAPSYLHLWVADQVCLCKFITIHHLVLAFSTFHT